MSYLRPGTPVVRIADGAVGTIRKSATYLFANGPHRGYSVRWDVGEPSTIPATEVRRQFKRERVAAPSRPVVSIDPDGVSIVAESAVVFPADVPESVPARRDNRGGKHAGNQGGRPSNESQGLESRTRKVMVRFTESEYATLLQCAEADPEAEGMELAVWLRDTLLDRLRH